MCRIAGIIDRKQKAEQLERNVQAMCDGMQHGGPDGEGFYSVPAVGLQFGHRRLALIDLSPAGQQPMFYNNRNLVITFNGEIYNYLDLKTELLGLGLVFNTQSDTEVILAAYQAWGINCFKRLKGMFAFALYDNASQVSYLVRDQFGIKPLYYSTANQRLIFASEVKAFTKTAYQFEANPDWKIYFLAFGHIPHPFTTLENVHSLSPGHFLSWNHQEDTHQVNCFKDKLQRKEIFDKKDGESAIAAHLNIAVKRNLIADAPVGVFLSGGLDSSIITLLANREVKEKLNTLSINFEEKPYSEEKYQHLVAGETSGEHHSYQVKEEDLNTHLDQIMSAMDQPTNDGINSWFINRYAKNNGLKAVLSGIGADELFGGYPSFKRMDLIKKLKWIPRFLLRSAYYFPSDKIKRIAYLSYTNPIGEYLFLRGFFVPQTIAKLLNINKKRVDNLLENFPIDKDLSKLEGNERASWLECHLFMQNQLLKDTDFMSMTHGIEVRVPFLDQDFVSYSNKIENGIRFSKQPKGLLINAFKNILPETVWNRPKMGFTFPLQEWFLKNKRITDEKLYDGHALRLINKFKTGKLHWSKAFALYQIAKRDV